MKQWLYFYDKNTGKELAAYTIREATPEEEEATRHQLAHDHNIDPADIYTRADITPANGIYYYFDCLDGLLGDKLLTPPEVAEILHGRPADLTEKDLIKVAANYEATLYRQEYKDGELINDKLLYDCFF